MLILCNHNLVEEVGGGLMEVTSTFCLSVQGILGLLLQCLLRDPGNKSLVPVLVHFLNGLSSLAYADEFIFH